MYYDRRPLHLRDKRSQYAVCAFCLVTCTVFRGPLPLCVFAVFFSDDLLDMVSDLSCKPITAKYTTYFRTAGIIGATLLALMYSCSSQDSESLSWVHVPVVFLAVAAALSLRSFIAGALGMRG